jgi:hypothetical protein
MAEPPSAGRSREGCRRLVSDGDLVQIDGLPALAADGRAGHHPRDPRNDRVAAKAQR